MLVGTSGENLYDKSCLSQRNAGGNACSTTKNQQFTGWWSSPSACQIKEPETTNARRAIVLNPDDAEAKATLRITLPASGSNLLFPGTQGGRPDPTWARDISSFARARGSLPRQPRVEINQSGLSLIFLYFLHCSVGGTYEQFVSTQGG
jgi:hypothetical protein